MFHP